MKHLAIVITLTFLSVCSVWGHETLGTRGDNPRHSDNISDINPELLENCYHAHRVIGKRQVLCYTLEQVNEVEYQEECGEILHQHQDEDGYELREHIHDNGDCDRDNHASVNFLEEWQWKNNDDGDRTKELDEVGEVIIRPCEPLPRDHRHDNFVPHPHGADDCRRSNHNGVEKTNKPSINTDIQTPTPSPPSESTTGVPAKDTTGIISSPQSNVPLQVQSVTIIAEIVDDTTPDVDNMQQVVEVEEPEPEIPTVYTEFQFYRGFNIFAPSVQLDGIETIKDFWDRYSFLEALGAIIYINVEGSWYAYNSEGGNAGNIPLNPYTAMIVYINGASLLGMTGIPYPRPDDEVIIPIGLSAVAFPMLPTKIQRPSDFIEEYGASVVIVTVKGMLKLVGRAGDEGDNPISENQGVIVVTENMITIDFPDVPQAPQAHRAGALATSWGRIKKGDK